MKPRKMRNEILVGSFLCLGIALFFLLLFLMGTLDPLLGRSVAVEADFEDVQGLQEGDPVYLFGMKVGKVDRISLLPPGAGEMATLRVSITIPGDYRPYLRQDSMVKIDKSLTGNISMVIQESGGQPLPEAGRLKGVRAADLATITERVKEVLGAGEEVLFKLSRIAGEVESKGSLGTAIGDFAAVARAVRDDLGPLQGQFHQTLDILKGMLEENRVDIRDTLSNLRETSGLVRSFTDRMQPIPEKLERGVEELERAGMTVAAVIAENRPQIDMILEDLRQTSTHAANLTAEIKRRPWRLLYRPSAAEEKAMELYDAAWAYNLGATELNRSIRELASCIDNDPGSTKAPDRFKLAYEQVRQSLEKQREAEEVFWERLRRSE